MSISEIVGAKIGENFDKLSGIELGPAQTPEDVAAFVSYPAGPDSGHMMRQER